MVSFNVLPIIKLVGIQLLFRLTLVFTANDHLYWGVSLLDSVALFVY